MVRPKRHSHPGYGSLGESTLNCPLHTKGPTSPTTPWHTKGRNTPTTPQHPQPPHRRSSVPRGTQGFSNLPKDRPGLGETAYTTSEPSLCTNGVLLPNTQVGRVSLLNTGGSTSTLRTLPNIGWPVETGRTIH